MSKMIQVRNVPDEVHRTLKSRAARQGMSLSDFIKKELERAAERPTIQEWLELTARGKPIAAGVSPAKVIRELRNSRLSFSMPRSLWNCSPTAAWLRTSGATWRNATSL
jgi:plasmid stability protein